MLLPGLDHTLSFIVATMSIYSRCLTPRWLLIAFIVGSPGLLPSRQDIEWGIVGDPVGHPSNGDIAEHLDGTYAALFASVNTNSTIITSDDPDTHSLAAEFY